MVVRFPTQFDAREGVKRVVAQGGYGSGFQEHLSGMTWIGREVFIRFKSSEGTPLTPNREDDEYVVEVGHRYVDYHPVSMREAADKMEAWYRLLKGE